MAAKKEKYRMLLPQIKCLIEGEDDLIANLANVVAALKETFTFLGGILSGERWGVGACPFQGPVVCTRIKKGRGVAERPGREGWNIGCTGCGCFSGSYSMQFLSRSEISASTSSDKGRSIGLCWMWTVKTWIVLMRWMRVFAGVVFLSVRWFFIIIRF